MEELRQDKMNDALISEYAVHLTQLVIAATKCLLELYLSFSYPNELPSYIPFSLLSSTKQHARDAHDYPLRFPPLIRAPSIFIPRFISMIIRPYPFSCFRSIPSMLPLCSFTLRLYAGTYLSNIP